MEWVSVLLNREEEGPRTISDLGRSDGVLSLLVRRLFLRLDRMASLMEFLRSLGLIPFREGSSSYSVVVAGGAC
jgi:hypothetical protein